ncbi:MAG: hypothetical protein VKK04_21030 [Synechococcales bacterium]|nr:hypothetical protein [Synechococcales bacterium]
MLQKSAAHYFKKQPIQFRPFPNVGYVEMAIACSIRVITLAKIHRD